jgi:hypothetical protein
MLTNGANGSKVFYDEKFSGAMDRFLFGIAA